ncbi:hypothetical protein [Myroides odoratus]|uniref:hypothetical protein n=1 Tax=Myroides odoratus TaxID=256 RepID=UPI0033418CB1
MNRIEKIIIENLEKNISIDLLMIGGIEELKKNLKEIISSRFLNDIVNLIIAELDMTDKSNIDFVNNVVSKGLKFNIEEITVKDIILTLCSNSEKFLGCFDTLLELLNDSTRTTFLRSQYLLGAFQIATNNPAKKYYLIGYLLEVDSFEDDAFFSNYIKVLGLSYSFFEEEIIFDKLSKLTSTKENDDGFYEMGMSYLRKGITAKSHNKAYESFYEAKSYFERVDNLVQTDALCYSLILDALLKCSNDLFVLNDLKGSLSKIEQTILLSIGWHKINTAIPWGKARNIEMMNWLNLLNVLNNLMDSFKEISWFEPKVVIENYLLQLYNSNRILLKNKSGVGVDLFIQPMIQMEFNKQETSLYLLDQWISSQSEHELWEDAIQLRKDMRTHIESVGLGNGKGAVEENALSVPFSERIPETKRSYFEQFKYEYTITHLNATSLILIELFEKIVNDLQVIPSFKKSPYDVNFKMHVYNTLKFLESRMDGTKSNNPAHAYLFNKNQLESALQMDYYSYMSAIPLNGEVTIEFNDIAGGRADVVFNHLNHKFIFEVKRELQNSSFPSLRQKYLGQAAEYQNTGPKLGGLLVLDLTNNSTSIGAIENNVKLEIIENEGVSERAVLVVKVRGNRTTPSKIKLPNK